MTDNQTKPSWNIPGLQPTLNGTGFMFEVLDEYAEDFISFAEQTDDKVMDMGCAFGVTSIRALEAGGHVTACDMDQGHLDAVLENTPEERRQNLECVLGHLPDVDFPPESFTGIFCSRVLHFLDGAAVDESVRKMYSWLKPGGRLYLVADTPYGIWRKFIPVFEAKRERGERWPGIMIGLENYLPVTPKGRSIDGPPFMNLLDPELLTRVCTEAGFTVNRASYIDRSDFGDKGRMDGRENAGILALKPA